jgi:hypothetical protein
MPTTLSVIETLHQSRFLQGPIAVVGTDAKAVAKDLTRTKVTAKVGGTSATTVRIPKGTAAIVDLNLVATAKVSQRKALLTQLIDKLPQSGTLFVLGPSAASSPNRLTPAAIKKLIDPKTVKLFPAINGTIDAGVKGIAIPIQRMTRPVSKAELTVATQAIPKKASSESRGLAESATNFVKKQFIMNATPIAATQKCHSWCWAAGLQMQCKSQGFNVDQTVFVKKIFGVDSNGNPPCVMSGPWSNIKTAIDGTVGTVNNKHITLSGEVIDGVPMGPDVKRLIKEIEASEPFLFAYQSHIYVCYGATWLEYANGFTQITRLELIDPWPTNARTTFIKFPNHPTVIAQIMGVLLLTVTGSG